MFFGKGDGSLNDLELCIVFVNVDVGEGFIKWVDVSGDCFDLWF